MCEECITSLRNIQLGILRRAEEYGWKGEVQEDAERKFEVLVENEERWIEGGGQEVLM